MTCLSPLFLVGAGAGVGLHHCGVSFPPNNTGVCLTPLMGENPRLPVSRFLQNICCPETGVDSYSCDQVEGDQVQAPPQHTLGVETHWIQDYRME